jgi:hypothetical protein
MDARRSIAAAALAVVAVVLAVTLGSGIRTTGGVEGAVFVPSGGTGSGARLSPGASASGSVGASADPTMAPSGPARPVATPAGGNDGGTTPGHTSNPASTPKPGPTPKPTPIPTSRPTPTPNPTATPNPTPTPGCITVPSLKGMTVQDARAAWTAAGFTGAFRPKPAPGQDTKVVQTQSQTAGACLPATSGVVVTAT